MTKAELQQDRDKWKEKAEYLQDELDSLNEAYCELENENYELTNNINVGIYNLDNFIFRAKIDGVWNEQLEEFIKNYMRWYNERNN